MMMADRIMDIIKIMIIINLMLMGMITREWMWMWIWPAKDNVKKGTGEASGQRIWNVPSWPLSRVSTVMVFRDRIRKMFLVQERSRREVIWR
jgi:hypothetical protein